MARLACVRNICRHVIRRRGRVVVIRVAAIAIGRSPGKLPVDVALRASHIRVRAC